MQKLKFESCARLPLSGDNCAIATRRLEPGTHLQWQGKTIRICQPILTGHRFLLKPVSKEEELFSWGLPFGIAERDIGPGEYLLNQGMAEELALRDLDFDPGPANFRNDIRSFELAAENFLAGTQVSLHSKLGRFEGYRRASGRGVGTRNYIAVIAANSTASSFVRLLQQRLGECAKRSDLFDGVVIVAHTEGGGTEDPHNRELLLRTLAGFLVHPNLGAVLVVDSNLGSVSNVDLREFISQNDYPIDTIPHDFYTLKGSLDRDLEKCSSIIQHWLPKVQAASRTLEPISQLRVALQCGGSDAFSGISGNPLAGWVAREIIRHGGSANHAETDELIGAESYMLRNVRSLNVARKFLQAISRYKEMASWHGVTAEGNPSGGNKLRGLYNINLKSIGAAMKRNPEVRVDDVLDYGEQMPGPGFFFMDSPGNDLESIAGQVASGANLILFTTGNGSITNFPFVPTLKLMTTTDRFHLVAKEMDVNAGEYLDGTSMNELGGRTFDLAIDTVSGQLTKGEKADHSQVSIWRNWMRTSSSGLAEEIGRSFSKTPIDINPELSTASLEALGINVGSRLKSERIGLILPTSLCAGQIALQIADDLQAEIEGSPISRFIALPHTEGCGYSYGGGSDLFVRSLLGHLAHPSVSLGMVLEHGCDKVHNGVLRDQLRKRGVNTNRYGWASIQLDGGIEKVSRKVNGWFRAAIGVLASKDVELSFKDLSLGFVTERPLPKALGEVIWEVIRVCLKAGATIIIPSRDELLKLGQEQKIVPAGVCATIEHGESPTEAGLHVMYHTNHHWVEGLTGLTSCGVQLIVGATHTARQGHPMVPVLQVALQVDGLRVESDLDVILIGSQEECLKRLLSGMIDVVSGEYLPRGLRSGNTDIQFTRGFLGFSS
jgi:altronate dehydratase